MSHASPKARENMACRDIMTRQDCGNELRTYKSKEDRKRTASLKKAALCPQPFMKGSMGARFQNSFFYSHG